MSRKTILIDSDDTQTEFVEPLLQLYNNKYDDNIHISDITDWNIHKFIKEDCNNIFKEFVDYDFIMNSNPISNSIYVINRLHQKYNIVFLSAVFPTNVLARHDKLSSMFDWYNYADNLIIATNKSLVHGDVLIDDRFSNHSSSVKHSILFDRPWNEKYKLNSNMYRMDNWLEIEKKIYELLD